MERPSGPSPAGSGRAPVLRAALVLGLWSGLAIAAARVASIHAQAAILHGESDFAAQILAVRGAGTAALHGAVAGLAAGTLAALAARRGTALALLAAALAAALLSLAVVGGWSAGEPLPLAGSVASGARKALSVLATACLLGGALLALLARAAIAGRGAARVLRSPLAALSGLLLLALVPATASRLLGPDVERMPVRQVVRDLLADPEEIEVVAHAGAEPHAGILCPSFEWAMDGGDLPSLVLPPPSEVRIQIRPEDGPVVLRARAGVDATTFRRAATPEPGEVPPKIVLLASVNGRQVFREPFAYVPWPRGTEWRDIGGKNGLRLSPGDVLTLRTEVRLSGGKLLDVPAEHVLAGFGNPVLERTTRVPRHPRSRERPSIVLVVMDTERADRVSTGGYERPTSPALERLAARGLLYENAQSAASWTWPSTASILTGLLPQEHGVTDDRSCYLGPDAETLAEALQAQGYTTAAWSTNPLVAPNRGFGQGFEGFAAPGRTFRKSSEVLEGVRTWIERNRERRFFLYLHLTDPHPPFDSLPEARRALAPGVPDDFSTRVIGEWKGPLLRGEGHDVEGRPTPELVVPPDELAWTSDLYDACVLSGDEALAAVLDELEAAGILEDTVVAYTSDHGEALLEHGLVGHGETLHQEEVHVPLVLAGPGVPRGVRVATPVANRHLAPTLARLAGAELSRAADGLDLARPRDGAVEARPIVLSTEHGWWNGRHRQPLVALREGDHVLHWAPRGGPWMEPLPGPGEVRLFDLARDPGETVDLAADDPERAEAMLARLQSLVTAAAARRTSATLPAGEATLELLRQLGYAGDG